jgi:hypothetical protein
VEDVAVVHETIDGLRHGHAFIVFGHRAPLQLPDGSPTGSGKNMSCAACANAHFGKRGGFLNALGQPFGEGSSDGFKRNPSAKSPLRGCPRTAEILYRAGSVLPRPNRSAALSGCDELNQAERPGERKSLWVI